MKVIACNEINIPMSMGSNRSMFIQKAWSYSDYAENCDQKYGINSNFEWAFSEFGGSNVTRDYSHYSRIIFTNGDLDPWSVGGVNQYIGPELPVLKIRGGAHHLDLRAPNEKDPHDVVLVR